MASVVLTGDKCVSISSIARVNSLSRHQVRRCFATGALLSHSKVQNVLSSLPAVVKSSSVKPVLIYDRLKFDETCQRLTVPFSALLTSNQRISSWAVLVQRRFFGIVFDNGAHYEYMLPIPPAIMVSSKNAGCYWDAILGANDGIKEVYSATTGKLISNIHSEFPECFALSLREVDAHSAVMKMVHHEASMTPDNVHSSFFNCGEHQNNLAVGSIVKALDTNLVAAMARRLF